MNPNLTPSSIRRQLLSFSTPENKKTLERFFKEEVDMMGVKSPDIKKVSREAIKWCKQNGGYSAALKLAVPLWKKGQHEEGVVAISLLLAFTDQFDNSTWKLADEWIDDITNWAHCDYLCSDLISILIDDYPSRRKQILKWTKSKNRWRRRAAAVSYVRHGRTGNYLPDIWKVATPLMPDEDDMVRKGVGWLLRETARTQPEKVVEFCKNHEHHANRLILRTASETMNEKWRKILLGK
ncbi:MAG TPA: DNA alkylation repair protein [bacterium]|jgi:3-methyladenine DNA glycosylase AlkD